MGYASVVKATDTSTNGWSIYNSVSGQAVGSMIVILIGLVPGYFFTVAFVEKLGRKFIQYMGFTMMTIFLVVIAGAWVPLKTHAVWGLVVIYALTFFFANFGPNTTTFIIPGEAFPTRCVCHGYAAYLCAGLGRCQVGSCCYMSCCRPPNVECLRIAGCGSTFGFDTGACWTDVPQS